MNKPKIITSQIFLDSGDPHETNQVIDLLGFLDGQTTNPSLIAKNPHIQELRDSGQLDNATIWEKYKIITDHIHEIIPGGAISVEVDATLATDYDSMLARARELATWFSGVYVKLPITKTGLQVAQTLVQENVNVNMTLCFSQDQAAAVHNATKGARNGQVFISPFIGRLDDQGIRGIDLIKNIVRMYGAWDSHVHVLGASIRNLNHLFGCILARAHCVTIPYSVAVLWDVYGITNDMAHYMDHQEISPLSPIVYKDLSEQDWITYDIEHSLTKKGLEKFSSDWEQLFVK
jgi:transaldolase